MTPDDFAPLIEKLQATFDTVEAVMDPALLQKKIADLTAQASAPDLWDDQENAQKITQTLSATQSDLERLQTMKTRLEDFAALVELGGEELMSEDGRADGQAIMEDAEATYKTLAADLAALEVRTLLNGEYDERFAVVTIRSGAGGVDAADFAQMLLRLSLIHI